MVEREGLMTREEILNAFPPKEEHFGGEKVKALVYRNLKEEIVFVVPGSTRWIEQEEQQESQTTM